MLRCLSSSGFPHIRGRIHMFRCVLLQSNMLNNIYLFWFFGCMWSCTHLSSIHRPVIVNCEYSSPNRHDSGRCSVFWDVIWLDCLMLVPRPWLVIQYCWSLCYLSFQIRYLMRRLVWLIGLFQVLVLLDRLFCWTFLTGFAELTLYSLVSKNRTSRHQFCNKSKIDVNLLNQNFTQLFIHWDRKSVV